MVWAATHSYAYVTIQASLCIYGQLMGVTLKATLLSVLFLKGIEMWWNKSPPLLSQTEMGGLDCVSAQCIKNKEIYI